MVTKTEIKRFLPSAKASLVDAIVNNWPAAEAVGINKPKRIRQFFANIAVETGGLTSVEESLNYSVDSLLKKFSRLRISEADARRLGRLGNRKADQIGIANTIYGGAWGKKNLGNIKPNDGWDMRGGGMLQTTGRSNYEALGFGSNPQALRNPATAFLTAVREWDKRGCNALADADKTTELRRKINGGTNGLEEVKDFLVDAAKVWPDNYRAPKMVPTPTPRPVVDEETDASIKPDPIDDVDEPVITEPEEVIPDDKDLYSGKWNKTVETVQQRLDALGYHEVGTVDGLWGNRTAGAITTFQNDNDLELSPKIDATLLAALMTAEPRKIDAERANATVADLRQLGDKEIKQADQTSVAGYATGGLALFSGGAKVLDDVKNQSETARSIWDTLAPVQNFLVDNIWLILGGVGAFVAWKAWKMKKERLEKHQTGKDVSL